MCVIISRIKVESFMGIIDKLKKALIFPLVGIIMALTINVALVKPTNALSDNNSSSTQVLTIIGDPIESPTETAETVSPTTTTGNNTNTEDSEDKESVTCTSQIGGLGWLICPAMGLLAKGIDAIYSFLEDFLVLQPIDIAGNSPVFLVWTIMRNISNVVFVIFLLVIIYSQITGFGISNYGIKKALPRLIVTAILVNLSFIICVLAIDVSNILGASIKDFIDNITTSALNSGYFNANISLNFYDLFTTVAAGGTIAGLALSFAGGPVGLLLALIPVLLGGIISVIIGLATISLRQAVVIALVAIAPLAFVAYLLPNTEKWFTKWKQIFVQMLIFYPTLSLLFGISRLASYIIISSSNSMIGAILGLAVQVLPLALAVSLMKMSGTVLGGVSSALSKLGDKANNGVRGAVQPYRDLNKQKRINKAMRGSFNPLSGASWQALGAKQRHNVAFKQDQANKAGTGLLNEQLNALRRNQRVIGYDKNNQPIYSQRRPRSNKFVDAEAENREIGLRGMADDLKTERFYGSLSSHLEENGIKNGKAVKTGKRMGGHYLDYRSQLQAKAEDDRSDERFYNESVIKASERYLTDTRDSNGALHKRGEIKDQAAYNRLITSAIGTAGFKSNLATAEGRRLADEARVNLIGDAYSRNDAQRASNVKRFESYMDNQATAEVIRQYEEMLANNNLDGIVASHEVLSHRGDYDQILQHMTKYMEDGNVKLGEESAQILALQFHGMKNADPTIGRLGKAINMETWRYTSGDRTTQTFDMEQYTTGRIKTGVDANGNNIYEMDHKNPQKQYLTKIDFATGIAGTPLNNIDRNAMKNIQYALDIADQTASPEEANRIREQALGNIMPMLINALPTYASGSEQVISASAFMTGTKFSRDDNGNTIWKDATRDANGNIIDQVGHDFAMQATHKYLTGLTARNALYIKSDTWSALTTRYQSEARANHKDWDDEKVANDANAKLRRELAVQIDRASVGNNFNLDEMKQNVYNGLMIGDIRKERMRRGNKFDMQEYLRNKEADLGLNLDSEYPQP